MIFCNIQNYVLADKKIPIYIKTTLALAVATLLSTSLAHAQKTTVKQDTKSSFEDAWDVVNLYNNDQGDYFKLSGLLQFDSTWVNSEQGDYEDALWRRFHFGFKAKQGEFKFALEASFNLNNSLADSYSSLTNANVSWVLDKDTELKLLKQNVGFSLDGKTSSKKLLTPQRNNLTNNLWFPSEFFTGISLKSKFADDWSYKTGIFSTDNSPEISFNDASYFALFSTSKKLTKNSFWDKGEVSFDYAYNDAHEDGATRDFSNVLSTSTKLRKNDWGLQGDISWGKGDLGQSDVFGIVVMPTYQQSEKLQWVTRYTYLKSNEDNGVRLTRYENRVVSGLGNQYQEIYGGVNWFLNAHKLKLQAGLQYTKMEDNANDGGAYDGWDFTLAMRSYW